MNTDTPHENSGYQKDSWKPMNIHDVDSAVMNQINAFLEDFPKLPVHVHQLIKIISDFDSSAREISRLVTSDPGMASEILKMVNSVHYGLTKKTDNILHAIVLLGYGEIRNIAIRCGVSHSIGAGKRIRDYDTRYLWEHSFLVSVCAESFEKNKESDRAGNLMTLGLLHDIGKFVLCHAGTIIDRSSPDMIGKTGTAQQSHILVNEELLFGINHPIIGAMLAKKWGLPPRIISVIEHHHDPSFYGSRALPEEFLKDIAIVSISDHIINYLSGRKSLLPEPAPEYFDCLGLTPPVEKVITRELEEKLKKERSFLVYIS